MPDWIDYDRTVVTRSSTENVATRTVSGPWLALLGGADDLLWAGGSCCVCTDCAFELGARVYGDMHVSNYADLRHSVTCLECIHVRDMR